MRSAGALSFVGEIRSSGSTDEWNSLKSCLAEGGQILKLMLCLVYPYRSWHCRPFGPFFTKKEIKERYLNTEKRDRAVLFTKTDRPHTPTQRRKGGPDHQHAWNQESNPSRHDIKCPDGCKSCQAQENQFFPSKIKMKTETVTKPILQHFVFLVQNHFL